MLGRFLLGSTMMGVTRLGEGHEGRTKARVLYPFSSQQEQLTCAEGTALGARMIRPQTKPQHITARRGAYLAHETTRAAFVRGDGITLTLGANIDTPGLCRHLHQPRLRGAGAGRNLGTSE